MYRIYQNFKTSFCETQFNIFIQFLKYKYKEFIKTQSHPISHVNTTTTAIFVSYMIHFVDLAWLKSFE